MEILNVGPLELIIILVIMFVILGPKDMVRTAQRIGRWVRSVTTSPMWREVWGISQDIRELPKKLMDETGLEEALTDIKTTTQEVTNEFNASINEVKQSATIPEIEHIRIENPLTTPPPDSVPSSENTITAKLPAWLEQPATVPAAEGEPAPAETAELPAILEVAEQAPAEAAPAPKKTRRKKQPVVEEQPVEVAQAAEEPLAAEELPGAEQPAMVEPENAVQVEPAPKKPRRKTSKVAETPAAEAQPASPIEVYDTPVAPAVETPAAQAAPVETVQPVEKKPRRKKAAEVVEAAEQTANQAAAQVAEPPVSGPVNGSAESAGHPRPEDAQPSIAPARKPRAPRAARQEQPAENSAAAPDIIQAAANSENAAVERTNGSVEGTNGSAKPPRPKKPRKTETQQADAQEADAQETASS